MQPIVRVSILRCPPDRFAEMRQMMIEAEKVLRPGIESMRGLLAFYVGADEMTSSLTNVSLWIDLAAATCVKELRFVEISVFGPSLKTCAMYKVVSYPRYWRRAGRAGATVALTQFGTDGRLMYPVKPSKQSSRHCANAQNPFCLPKHNHRVTASNAVCDR
jgi:hypothetical protein